MDTGTNYADLFYSESAGDEIALKKYVNDNPASTFARFLLLYHYKKHNDPKFEKFANQSSLYFNYPYWLQLQLVKSEPKKEEPHSIQSNETGHFAVSFPEEESEEQIIPSELKNKNAESTEPIEIINHNVPQESEEQIIPSELKNENAESTESVEITNHNVPQESEEQIIPSELKNENAESTEPVEILNHDLPVEETNEQIISSESNNQNLESTERVEIINHNVTEETNEQIIPSELKNENGESTEPVEIINLDLPVEETNEQIIASEVKNENIESFKPGDNIEPINSSLEEPVAFEPKEEILETDQQKNEASFENTTEEPLIFEPKEETLEHPQPVEIINNNPSEEENKEQMISSESKDETIENFKPADNIEPINLSVEEPFAFEPKEEILETDQQKNEASFENTTEETLAFEPKEEPLEHAQPVEEINNTHQEGVQEEIVPAEPHSPISTNTAEEQVAFEPLHTVDYFASQGIKIREDELTNDKLGNQVKSFTAWLKSMKKLHPGKLPEQNGVIEKIIQSSAEESNADAQILTEAMAEVLIKQNKSEKAIEMYQKLSLLNPSKSAYFAAKIESIKTN